MTRYFFEAKVEWQYFRDRKSGCWIAICAPLNQTVSGATFSEMNHCIGEALDLLFRDLLENDELDSFLREHGWEFKKEPTQDPSKVDFDVPWSLRERQGAYDQEGVLC